jgi:hypothetical protein
MPVRYSIVETDIVVAHEQTIHYNSPPTQNQQSEGREMLTAVSSMNLNINQSISNKFCQMVRGQNLVRTKIQQRNTVHHPVQLIPS